MRKTKFGIKGMHCPSCELLIKEELEETVGVHRVNVSQEDSCASVEYDESKINEANIKNIIRNEGYEVE